MQTLPLPETLNAYIVYLELIGNKRQATEHNYQLVDLYAMRRSVERSKSDRPAVQPVEDTYFIGHSSKDRAFVDRLYADLKSNGFRCWYAPHDIRTGDEFRLVIDQALQEYGGFMLVLSRNSVKSDWARDEVEAIFEREHREQKQRLFPIRLDDSIMSAHQAWAASIRRQRHIADFREWQQPEKYTAALTRLLTDLRPRAKDPRTRPPSD